MKLSGNVVIESRLDRLYDRLAGDLRAVAEAAVGNRGVFHLALSGGSTPRPLYERLVVPSIADHMPWSHTHLWVVDERRVSEDDERSNIRMIRHSLADRVPIPADRVHPMPVLEQDPATRYEHELAEAFGIQPPSSPSGATDPPRLDFVLLGMGDDGHTASLFPLSSALGVRDRWIAVNDGAGVTPPPRVTMTFPLLNAADHVAVLITGEKKSPMLRRVDRATQGIHHDAQTLPITAIHPQQGTLTWFLDASAADASEPDTTPTRWAGIEKIVSGAQTGADRAALDVAIELGMDHGGWVPRGRIAEDGKVDPHRYPNLVETDRDDYIQRTELNVRDADATLIFSHGPLTGGSAYTRDHAEKTGKPWLHVDLQTGSENEAIQRIHDWVGSQLVKTLNVAGPRASGDPRIYRVVQQCLTRWLTGQMKGG